MSDPKHTVASLAELVAALGERLAALEERLVTPVSKPSAPEPPPSHVDLLKANKQADAAIRKTARIAAVKGLKKMAAELPNVK